MPMNARSRRQAARIGTQAAELLVAAPQVVAHRLGRMALSGPRPSVNDRREFHRMGAEKVAAFGEAWQAMTLQMLKSNQQLAAAMMRSGWPHAAARRGGPKLPPLLHALGAWQGVALDVLSQGIRPVHRRAVSNAKRLKRLKQAATR
jgi:hypothetical protein